MVAISADGYRQRRRRRHEDNRKQVQSGSAAFTIREMVSDRPVCCMTVVNQYKLLHFLVIIFVLSSVQPILAEQDSSPLIYQ